VCSRSIEHREAVKVLEDIRADVVLSDIEVPGAMNGSFPSCSGLAQPAPS
jgi:hypothetical protein